MINGTHSVIFSSMCEDIEAFIAALAQNGFRYEDITEQPCGARPHIVLPADP